MCDALVALGTVTASGSTLWAKNSDRPPDERQILEWHGPRPAEQTTATTYLDVHGSNRQTHGVLVSRPSWMWGVEHGVNDVGVVVGNEMIFTTVDPRTAPPGLTGMDIVRLAVERADDAAAAVDVVTEMVERYGQGGSGHEHRHRPYWSSFLIADARRAFVLETNDRRWALEEVNAVRAISNRTTIEAIDAQWRHPRQPVETQVDPRWHASQALLSDQPLRVDQVMQHLRSHANGPWSVCMHVDGVEATRASMIVQLSHHGPPQVWVCQGAPCQCPYHHIHLDGSAAMVRQIATLGSPL
jgi:hypothetical protein